jgi:hypothetical protein
VERYDFDSFLSRVESLDRATIIKYADEEARRAVEALRVRRGAPAAREAGAGRYASDLKALLNYLYQRGRSKPGSFTDYQFRGLRKLRVTTALPAALVSRGSPARARRPAGISSASAAQTPIVRARTATCRWAAARRSTLPLASSLSHRKEAGRHQRSMISASRSPR